MRKHGWQLPYHPLQVVAMAVLLALGFAFYVFFLPFVGKKLFQYVVMGLYTPLVTSVFCLYVWCIATDPADSGVFKSNKYLDLDDVKQTHPKVMRQGRQSFYAVTESQAKTTGDKPLDEGICIDGIGENLSDRFNGVNTSSHSVPCLVVLFGWCPLSFLCNQHHSHGQSSEQQVSEDGMLYCSLCKVEVFKYSKHCRVCDKCIDGFDHHCRWLNNCIGRKNYRRFFVLMVSALLLLILQWSMGVLVLILCFIKRKQFSVEIIAKLGSSFSLLPFVVVVASCTVLAMVTTIPLTQLFFFHVLLIKKGISTYDYIIALREQVQQASGAQQSPQMSPVNSLTGLSSASSFSAVQHGAWCTPPHSFLEDHVATGASHFFKFDVVPPESGTYINPLGKRMMTGNSSRKRRTAPVTINPWTLAQLNAEVSKVAAQAKKKSRILQPVGRQEIPMGQETDISSCGSGRMTLRLDNRRRAYKRGRLHVGRSLEPLTKVSTGATDCKSGDLDPEASISLPPLQLKARSAFRTRRAMSATITTSSPDSSISSSDLHPSRVSSFGAEEARGITSLPFAVSAAHKGTRLLRSTSDGYEASGGEDSDHVPSRIIHRSSNWTNLLFDSSHGGMAGGLKGTILGRPANLS